MADGSRFDRDHYAQPPIHFGGVQLAPLVDTRQPRNGDHASPPAGEGSPEARLVNVSRMALAARIKHGVPLADMVDHIITLAAVEANLMSYQDPDRLSRFPLADG